MFRLVRSLAKGSPFVVLSRWPQCISKLARWTSLIWTCCTSTVVQRACARVLFFSSRPSKIYCVRRVGQPDIPNQHETHAQQHKQTLLVSFISSNGRENESIDYYLAHFCFLHFVLLLGTIRFIDGGVNTQRCGTTIVFQAPRIVSVRVNRVKSVLISWFSHSLALSPARKTITNSVWNWTVVAWAYTWLKR